MATFTVTLHNLGEDGSTNLDPVTVTEGVLLWSWNPQEQIFPSRSYHIFRGWYKESNFTTQYHIDTTPVIENLNLYAKWELAKFCVNGVPLEETCEKKTYNYTATISPSLSAATQSIASSNFAAPNTDGHLGLSDLAPYTGGSYENTQINSEISAFKKSRITQLIAKKGGRPRLMKKIWEHENTSTTAPITFYVSRDDFYITIADSSGTAVTRVSTRELELDTPPHILLAQVCGGGGGGGGVYAETGYNFDGNNWIFTSGPNVGSGGGGGASGWCSLLIPTIFYGGSYSSGRKIIIGNKGAAGSGSPTSPTNGSNGGNSIIYYNNNNTGYFQCNGGIGGRNGVLRGAGAPNTQFNSTDAIGGEVTRSGLSSTFGAGVKGGTGGLVQGEANQFVYNFSPERFLSSQKVTNSKKYEGEFSSTVPCYSGGCSIMPGSYRYPANYSNPASKGGGGHGGGVRLLYYGDYPETIHPTSGGGGYVALYY